MRSVLGDQLAWDEAQREIDQRWNNQNIVQVPEHWNKIWNQVEGHAEIADGETQKDLGAQRSSLVGENPPIDGQLALESTREVFASLPHVQILASPSNETKMSHAADDAAGCKIRVEL
jgi:hypothetical protein